MAALFVLPMTGVSTVEAQNPFAKQLAKERKKQYKKKMAQYTKEGWKLVASSKTIEVALLEHYSKLFEKGDAVYELVGIASKVSGPAIGKQRTLDDATKTYAQSAKSFVQGRVTSDMANNASDISTDFDHFYAAYERLVAAEVKGELKESFTIYRELKGGGMEMHTYYIIDQESATKARLRAMELAAKETEMAQKQAEQVSKFIREGFSEYK